MQQKPIMSRVRTKTVKLSIEEQVQYREKSELLAWGVAYKSEYKSRISKEMQTDIETAKKDFKACGGLDVSNRIYYMYLHKLLFEAVQLSFNHTLDRPIWAQRVFEKYNLL